MTKKRKSAFLIGPQKVELREHDMPDITPGSLLVKVYACAICGSDIRIINHGNPRINYPQIIGHEIAGEVVGVGKGVKDFKVGDTIALGADVPCGKCDQCKKGMANCCDTNYAIGYQFEGGFSEYILLDPLVVNGGPIHKYKKIDHKIAALAEPLACCINGYERGLMDERKNCTIVIFGAGPIGLLLSLLAPTYKAKQVIMIDPNESRLQRAKNEFGVKEVINPTIVNPVEAVMTLTNGRGADMVFTACAVQETHEQAIAMLAKRGVVNLFGGLPKTSPPITFYSNDIHYKEAYITGSHGSTPQQHKKALEQLESGRIDLSKLITHLYSLSDIEEALEMASSGDALKVIICPGEKNV
ncbi:MAG: alcohol dehydrogenase catalytic domain-containing protein [Patescibacteria group bacterium]|nr:alcohol dehydrogenase catalytic domain-containing protein [Patescibacteria group bacterium]